MTLVSRMRWLSFGLSLGLLWIVPSQASAWELFRSENPDVREGNERLLAGDAAGAVTAYDRAVRALPSEPAVHLDRGLALLHAARFDEAREELLRATEPPASAEVRAAAHYDLGIAFYQQGDAAAAENHEEAQRLFREAADAFRNSLRQTPGNRDAAWNLELSLRRIREQQEQQEQQEQEQEQQEQQERNQEQESQQDGEQNEQEREGQERNEQSSEENAEPNDSSQEQDSEGESSDPSSEQNAQQQEESQQDAQDSAQEPNSEGTTDRSVPADMSRVLDALEDGEENLERALARSRGQRQARRVIRDW